MESPKKVKYRISGLGEMPTEVSKLSQRFKRKKEMSEVSASVAAPATGKKEILKVFQVSGSTVSSCWLLVE